jgi:hypothetical protein
MTFIDRTILVALVAMAIPLALHFMGRRRARVVVLPTARFAEGAHAESRGRLRLRRLLLMATRMAVIACLVLALAGPQWGGTEGAGAQASAPRAPSVSPGVSSQEGTSAPAGDTRELAPTARTTEPIKVLVIDAANEKGLRVRSADLVAAALSGDTLRPKKVWRRAVDTGKTTDDAVYRGDVDVVFWVGPHAVGNEQKSLSFIGVAREIVWVPADPVPPDPELASYVGNIMGEVVDVPSGVTIDPEGYTSDLLAAFEAGTSGDLGAPVFRRRIELKGTPVLRFRDGRPAAVEREIAIQGTSQKDRVVALAVGPSPVWGDLGSRQEFVVLMNSLAEALAPHAVRAPGVSPGISPLKESSTPAEDNPVPTTGARTAQTPYDLTLCFVLAMALALVAESLLASARLVPRA